MFSIDIYALRAKETMKFKQFLKQNNFTECQYVIIRSNFKRQKNATVG